MTRPVTCLARHLVKIVKNKNSLEALNIAIFHEVAFRDVLQKQLFYKFYRKTHALETLFNKVASVKPATLLKRDFDIGVFL